MNVEGRYDGVIEMNQYPFIKGSVLLGPKG